MNSIIIYVYPFSLILITKSKRIVLPDSILTHSYSTYKKKHKYINKYKNTIKFYI